MHWYLDVLKKYTLFSGRARRKEYWMFFLFNFVISAALGIIGSRIGIKILDDLYTLGVFIPSLAVFIRRLHDTGRSGWWALLILLPVIGWIALLIFVIQDSQSGANKYGSNPKGVTSPASASAGEAPRE